MEGKTIFPQKYSICFQW